MNLARNKPVFRKHQWACESSVDYTRCAQICLYTNYGDGQPIICCKKMDTCRLTDPIILIEYLCNYMKGTEYGPIT